jgi:hypothetical protein
MITIGGRMMGGEVQANGRANGCPEIKHGCDGAAPGDTRVIPAIR